MGCFSALRVRFDSLFKSRRRRVIARAEAALKRSCEGLDASLRMMQTEIDAAHRAARAAAQSGDSDTARYNVQRSMGYKAQKRALHNQKNGMMQVLMTFQTVLLNETIIIDSEVWNHALLVATRGALPSVARADQVSDAVGERLDAQRDYLEQAFSVGNGAVASVPDDEDLEREVAAVLGAPTRDDAALAGNAVANERLSYGPIKQAHGTEPSPSPPPPETEPVLQANDRQPLVAQRSARIARAS
jgi:hypothetical protein